MMPKPIPNIGNVAKRALETIDITILEDLTSINEKSLSKLHGVGPKAIKILKKALEANQLSFSDSIDYPYNPPFLVLGDLNCDNAPKRRYIRNFIIAWLMGSQKKIIENAILELQSTLVGKESFSNTDQLVEEVDKRKWNISSLKIHQILSHGKEGAASGRIALSNGKFINFAAFFRFESHRKEALINTWQCYIIEED